MPALEFLAVLGAGLDRVDPLPPRVRVAAVGDYLTEDVADLAIALLVMASRRLVAADAFVRAGRWAGEPFPLGRGLSGRRLGLIGYGRIGRAIARRAAAAGMRILAHTPTPRPDVTWCETPLVLAEASDTLVLSCPGGEATRGLIGARELAALGPEGVLVNVARGSVVDEAALVAALAAGRLGGAGLDVFEAEPRVPEALRRMENVVLTPHVGSATVETRAAMGDLVCDNLDRFLADGTVLTPVPECRHLL